MWYTRDERVSGCEVLHPHWGVLYKSDVYALKVLCLTLGGLPCALERRVRGELAEIEQSVLTAWERSAEGIVGEDVPTAGTGNEPRKAGRTHLTEGSNGFKGIK